MRDSVFMTAVAILIFLMGILSGFFIQGLISTSDKPKEGNYRLKGIEYQVIHGRSLSIIEDTQNGDKYFLNSTGGIIRLNPPATESK